VVRAHALRRGLKEVGCSNPATSSRIVICVFLLRFPMRSYQVPNMFSSPPQVPNMCSPHFDSIMLWQISPPLSLISGPKRRNSVLQNRTFLFWGASIVSFFLSDESIKLAHCKTKKSLGFELHLVKMKPTTNAHFTIAKGLHLLKRN